LVRFFFAMKTNTRIASNKEFKLFQIERPFSFFDFVDNCFPGLTSLKRIFSQIRQLEGKTMILEEIENSDDLIEENEDLEKLHCSLKKSKSFRLSFFSVTITNETELKTIKNDFFLGYAIIKQDRFSSSRQLSRIYESVISISHYPNNFIHGMQNWKCLILDEEFYIKGYLYAQQNHLTNVCAHVAIRSAVARYHPDGDISYREMNDIIGVDHVNKKATPGLIAEDIIKILETSGANCFVGDFSNPIIPPVPFQKYLYSSIESGCPAIVCFGVKQGYHAIPIFGHTFNQDTWVPNADFSYFQIGAGTQYIPSESWLSMFIGHDDNFGSNFCIPRRYLATKTICGYNTQPPEFCKEDSEGVVYAIGTTPKAVKMNPIRAEAIGVEYLFMILNQVLDTSTVWCKRLQNYAKDSQLVIRPILITLEDYIFHLKNIKDWNGKLILNDVIEPINEIIESGLYWLIELSVPELFQANRRKIGEVLLRSDVESVYNRDFSEFVIARIPDRFVLFEGLEALTPKFKFIQTGMDSHVELFGTQV